MGKNELVLVAASDDGYSFTTQERLDSLLDECKDSTTDTKTQTGGAWK